MKYKKNYPQCGYNNLSPYSDLAGMEEKKNALDWNLPEWKNPEKKFRKQSSPYIYFLLIWPTLNHLSHLQLLEEKKEQHNNLPSPILF